MEFPFSLPANKQLEIILETINEDNRHFTIPTTTGNKITMNTGDLGSVLVYPYISIPYVFIDNIIATSLLGGVDQVLMLTLKSPVTFDAFPKSLLEFEIQKAQTLF